MTNAEKFKEVFGYEIKDDDPPCIATFTDMKYGCNTDNCADCPLCTFWEDEYIEPDKMQ